MIRRFLAVLGVAGVICITGCASHNIEATAPEPRRLGKNIPSFRAPQDPEPSGVGEVNIEEPTGGLALREAVALALMRNPELAIFSWEETCPAIRTLETATITGGPNSIACSAVVRR